MQLGGAGGLLLTTLMARWGGQASMPGGGSRSSNEFRAARIAAEAASAQIVLGTLLNLPHDLAPPALGAYLHLHKSHSRGLLQRPALKLILLCRISLNPCQCACSQ